MNEISFRELMLIGEQQMLSDSKSQKTIDNAKSILRKHIILASDSTEASIIGDQFDSQLDVLLTQAQLATPSNPRAVRSVLNKWAAIYRSLQSARGLPDCFQEALQFLFIRHDLIWPEGTRWAGGLKFGEVAKATGVTREMLRDWYYGRYSPAPKSEPSIRKLEEYFGLADGALVATCNIYGHYGDKVTQAEKVDRSQYALKITDLPEETASEIKDLLDFKTSTFVPLGMKRIDTWDLVDPKNYGSKMPSYACVNGKVAPTGQLIIAQILRFFGYLVSQGLVPINDISLAHIADIEAVLGYFSFLEKRRGRTTTNLKVITVSFAGLLNPDGGYIPQRSALSRRYSSTVPEENWSKYCGAQRLKLLKLLDGAKKSIKPGLDADVRISTILKSDEPMKYLHLLDQRMGNHKPSPTAFQTQLGWMRHRLLMRLMSTNPLRINQFKMMTWRPDNTGNLREDDSGQWWIYFEASAFKNRHQLKGKSYYAKVPDWAAELIPTYLREVRPYLVGADESDYLFLKIAKGNVVARIDPEKGPEQYMIKNLQRDVTNITAQYLGDIVPGGFGPHAFRHIVATHFLKAKQNIDMAAVMLHDKPETVRERYGHLCTNDAITVMNDITSGWSTAA